MMKRTDFLKTLLIPLASTPAFAKVTVTPTNGGYTVQSCDNYKEKSLVSFKVGANGIEQLELAKNSCATKTYSPGVLSEGSVIIVENKKEGKTDRGVVSSNNSGNSSTETSNNDFGRITLSARLVDDTTVEITGCNPKFKPSNPVSVTNRDSQGRTVSKMADVRKVNGESCFVVQFKKGEINSGDEIGVGIYGVEKPIALSVGNLPWRTATTTPQPTPTVPVTPVDPGTNTGTNTGTTAPDTRIIENRNKIQNEAQKAANRFADQMVKSIGKIENVRYNLYLGFRQAESFYKRLGSDLSSLPEYNDGYTSGIRQGSDTGRNAGRQYGAEQGQAIAQNDVASRFEQAMATHQRPSNVPRQNLDVNSFSGLNPSLPAVVPVADRLKKEDRDLQRDLRSVTVVEDGIVLADSVYVDSYKIYDIYSLQDYKADLLLSNYRAEKAFEAWKTNLFNERESAYDYYNDIGRTSVYQHAEANRQNFAADFIEQYDRVIAKKWNDVVMRQYPRVQDMGQQLYIKNLKNYAYDLGQNAGYADSYKRSSRDGYSETVESSYRNSFNSLYNNYATSAVITDVVVEARAGTTDGSLTLGDAIVIILKSATNRGMANGEIRITASPQVSIGVMKAVATLPIQALTRIQQAQSASMLYVNNLQSVDSVVSFSVQVDNRNYSFSLRTSLESLVKRLGEPTNSANRGLLVNLLVKTLAAEWNDKSSLLANGFNNRKGDLYLERFVNAYRGLTIAEQNQVKQSRDQIKAAYGSKPGFFSGHRDDYASAIELLEGIGF